MPYQPVPVQFLYLLNDNRLVLTGLRDHAGVYQNAATVTATLVDAGTGAAVAGQSWPVTLSYVSASNGTYTATLQDGVAVTVGQRLRLKIAAISGGVQGYWNVPVRAIDRQE